MCSHWGFASLRASPSILCVGPTGLLPLVLILVILDCSYYWNVAVPPVPHMVVGAPVAPTIGELLRQLLPSKRLHLA
jgi:hypothetical protein